MNKYYLKRSESIKEKRKLLREQSRNGNEEGKRLWFVSAILKNKGIKRHEAAAALGVSPQNLSYIFTVQDDCYLDAVQRILDFAGIRCRVTFDACHSEECGARKNKQNYIFCGNFQVAKEPICPRFVTACPKNARLRFLAELILDMGIPFTEFIRIINMRYSTVKNYFTRDNIKVSTLCAIAERTGTNIIWELNE